MSDVRALITKQFEGRLTHKSTNSIKINLYKGYEVEAVASSIENLSEFGELAYPDCLMVADSYLTTHLGRSSTRMGAEYAQFFLSVFLDLVYEVRIAMGHLFHSHPLYLIADMPDGSCDSIKSALRSAESMIKHGADVVKVETESDFRLHIIEELSKSGICVMAHIGYTPQTGTNRAYGATYAEALSVFAMARRVRDCGSCAVVIERVSEIVNQMLCTNRRESIPVYSIFSGKSEYGGQSLNVWDSVFRPTFKAKFFPPTATFDVTEFPRVYTLETIRDRFSELLRLTLTNQFPLSPKTSMQLSDLQELMKIDPWADKRSQ